MRFRVFISAIAVLAAVMLPPAAYGQGRRPPGGPRVARPKPRPPGRTVLDRLERMSPEQRDRVLSNLPPERRKRVEEQLEQFHQLPPAERERLRDRLQRFRQLPPERQAAARKLFGRFGELPQDRRPLVAEEFRSLRQMEEADRRARVNSDEFRSRFSPAEQQLLQDFCNLLAPPP